MLTPSQGSTSAPSVMAVSHSLQDQYLPEDWNSYSVFNNFKAIKKQFRHDRPALIVIHIANEEDENLGKKVVEFVRKGLSNFDTRIVLLKQSEFVLDEINWMEQQQINACLIADDDRLAFNLSALSRELDTFCHIDNNQREHHAETEMLMCIAQFSKEAVSLKALLKEFSQTLAALSYASCSVHVKIKEHTQCAIDYCNIDESDFIDNFSRLIGAPQIPDFLQHTIDEKHPQIDLIPNKIDLSSIESHLQTTIGSYLTFPIVAYGNVLYLLFYLIPDAHMDKVSMRKINIINKACEQLTILLERRQAEVSLKNQYERLKKALVDLKSTKQELAHKEKMASIGQMAAGIAHEINNPLSYVISNFSSMDSYLESIVKLQKLQSEFLQSIDLGQDQKISQMKQSITDYEEEADIQFVFEDIRSVISDSSNGLKRVKNIITDLKSFTYSQSTELEICDINYVVDESLMLLKFEMLDDIVIEKNIAVVPQFMAHNGLMVQVVSNLIKNAIQAMREHNTLTPVIAITAECRDDKIVILIKDNGPGIPEEARGKIFDPFFTTKTIGEGTGLGLSVVFNIIKRLNGELTFNSKTGQYTEFVITFALDKCSPTSNTTH